LADLGYFTIPVGDIDRGKAFYGELLGWQFEAGDSYAHVGNTSPPGGLNLEKGSHPRLWFRVDDINAAVGRVRDLGGEAGEPKESDSGWASDCRDDQGTHFSLWQPAPGF
jgi:uncharacterized protein